LLDLRAYKERGGKCWERDGESRVRESIGEGRKGRTGEGRERKGAPKQ